MERYGGPWGDTVGPPRENASSFCVRAGGALSGGQVGIVVFLAAFYGENINHC